MHFFPSFPTTHRISTNADTTRKKKPSHIYLCPGIRISHSASPHNLLYSCACLFCSQRRKKKKISVGIEYVCTEHLRSFLRRCGKRGLSWRAAIDTHQLGAPSGFQVVIYHTILSYLNSVQDKTYLAAKKRNYLELYRDVEMEMLVPTVHT